MKPEFVGGPFRLSWLLFPLAVLIAIVAVMAICAGIAQKALAQSQEHPDCAPYSQWVEGLKRVRNETEVSFGMSQGGGGSILTIFASPKGETWTALIVGMKSGIACQVFSGTDYYQIAVIKKGEPA